jgi:hypothetical protein
MGVTLQLSIKIDVDTLAIAGTARALLITKVNEIKAQFPATVANIIDYTEDI